MPIARKSLLLTLSLLLAWVACPLGASDDSIRPPATAAAGISAEDFDWRDMVPRLAAAADLPGEQGIKSVLENSGVLRAYVAQQVRADCGREGSLCAGKGESSMLEQEVTKRIDAMVEKGIFHQHKKLVVDCPLSRQPFPFSEIAAIKSENQRDAYFILQLADRNYKAADVQAKYGAPQDTDIFQWYSVYKYRVDSAGYTGRAVFEINPVDGAVVKVAVSVRARKRH